MKPADYNASVVVYSHSENAKIIYPFYWRHINHLPQFASIKQPLRHIVSPYGYGGALYEGHTEFRNTASESFEILFNKELRQNGYVTEFVREDIFSERLAKRSVGQVIEQQRNAVVRLDRSEDETWRTYKHKVRKNVKRAKDSGLRVVFDKTGEYLQDFLKVYYKTMTRTEASESFFIPCDRFSALGETLGKSGGLLYVHVLGDNEIVSTELLLLSKDAIYSFLGGTLASAFEKRPNDLLKHEVIKWGRENGYKYYVLGGGVTPGDGIFKYKEAFDPGNVLPFYVRA